MKARFKLSALAAVLAATAIGLARCGGGGGGDAQASASPSTTAPAAEMGEMETTETSSVSVESPAADLRVMLDRVLGEHAILAMLATQKDFEAIAAALDQNSVELAEAIASVYGEEAGKEFLDGDLKWRAHRLLRRLHRRARGERQGRPHTSTKGAAGG